MKKIIKFFVFGITLISFYFINLAPAKAVCPVCTVAVGAGLGLSRYLGIDDAASGIWFGGLIMALALWSANWLKKKNINIPYGSIISMIVWFILTIIPLKLGGVMGHPNNTILGIDKLLFGIILGIFTFYLGIAADKKIRQSKGRQLIDFQKVILPVAFLLTASVIMFLLTSLNLNI